MTGGGGGGVPVDNLRGDLEEWGDVLGTFVGFEGDGGGDEVVGSNGAGIDESAESGVPVVVVGARSGPFVLDVDARRRYGDTVAGRHNGFSEAGMGARAL